MSDPRLVLDSDEPDVIDGRHLRAVAFQAVRLAYARRALERSGLDPNGATALVVGSGRGLLARGLAGLGLDVTAIDPSPAATALAEARGGEAAGREAAGREAAGGEVGYRTAPAEDLGLDSTYDLAFYTDTFEITPSLDDVLTEAAGAVRPGGILLYDTVNRTPIARLLYLLAFQRLAVTRIMPRDRYSADRLRPPPEVDAALQRHGFTPQDTCSFKPKNLPGFVSTVLDRRRGRITDEEIPSRAAFVLEPQGAPVVTYLGSATRRPADPS